MKHILAVTLLMMAAPRLALGQCSEADRKKLEEFDRAWGEAGQRGDRAFLQNVYADDYVSASPAGMLTKGPAIDNAIAQFERAKANGDRLTYDHYIVTCTPTSAVITHRAETTTKVDGKERTLYFRSVHALEKRGARWQVVSDAGHALDDATLLLYMERDWNDAAKKRDVAWFERNYAGDATDINSRTGALRSKAEEIASMKTDKSVLESLDLSDVTVRVEGNTAVVTGVNRVKGRDEANKPFDRRVRFTDTFVKRDGRWQVWATQGTVVQQ